MKADQSFSFFVKEAYAYYLAVDNTGRAHVISLNSDGQTALSLKEFFEIAEPEAVDALAMKLPEVLEISSNADEDGISFPFKINGRIYEVCVRNDAIQSAARCKLTGDDEFNVAFDKYRDRFVAIALAKFSRAEIDGDKIFISREDVERLREAVHKAA